MVGSARCLGTARRISPSCSQATTHGASSVTSTPPPGSITGSPAPGVYRRAPSPPTRPCIQAEPTATSFDHGVGNRPIGTILKSRQTLAHGLGHGRGEAALNHAKPLRSVLGSFGSTLRESPLAGKWLDRSGPWTVLGLGAVGCGCRLAYDKSRAAGSCPRGSSRERECRSASRQ